MNDHLMYMFQLQNLASHKPVAPANGQIEGQSISVVNPHQISLMQMDLPDKNPDIPLLGTSSSKPGVARVKMHSRARVLPFRTRMLLRRKISFRPTRLLGSFGLRTNNRRWRPTISRFWKRSYTDAKKHKERKAKYLRRLGRKRSKRKTPI